MKRLEHKSYAELSLFLNAELVASRIKPGRRKHRPGGHIRPQCGRFRAFEHGVN